MGKYNLKENSQNSEINNKMISLSSKIYFFKSPLRSIHLFTRPFSFRNNFWIKSNLIIFLIFLCLQTSICSLYAEDEVDREYTIKASMLLKFTEFIQWPERYSSLYGEEPINICIQGKDSFGDLLDYVNDHDILRRSILIRRSIQTKNVNSCHILFIKDVNDRELESLRGEIENAPILVISETEEIIPSWVAINFRKIKNHIKFEINKAAFERSGLNVSSELMNLALSVLRVD